MISCRASVLVTVVIAAVSVVRADIQFMLSQNKGTWQEASGSCKSIRGSLAILDNLQLQTMFNRDIQPPVGEKVWVGRYLAYTHVVTTDGCYRNQTLDTRRTSILVNNYLVTCLRECPDTLYFGMQGQLCYCMDVLPSQAVPVPGTNCQTPCPGEKPGSQGSYLSQCGSVDPRLNTVSVYRRIRANEIRIDENLPNQGECIAYNAVSNHWVPQDCGLQKLFTCDAKQCPGPAPMCVMESNVPGTWFAARTRCDGNGGHLATVNVTTSAYFRQKVILGDPLYWTGLHRKEAIVWNYDNNSRHLDQSDRCFAVSRKSDGTWEWQMDWCLSENRYACVRDQQPTPAPTTARPTTVAPVTRQPVTTPRPAQNITTRSPDTLPTVNPWAKPISVTSGSRSSIQWHVSTVVTLCISMFSIWKRVIFVI